MTKNVQRNTTLSLVGALAVLILGIAHVQGQNIGINTTGNPPHASAILDVDATGMSPKAGILLPRMTTAERNAIPSPAQSLTIYNTTTNTLDFYTGTVWRAYTDALASAVVAGGTGPGIGVAFNTTGAAAHPSALLDISSTTKGILLPRTVDASIASPTEGLLFFSTQSLGMRYYNGSEWKTAGCSATGVAGAGGSQTVRGSGVNASGANAHHSAVIDLSSTTLGLKLPKLTNAERDALPSPAPGMLIYNSTNTRVEFFNGTEWRYVVLGEGFKTEWTTSAPNETITLPLNSGNSSFFNCTVYWGDGSTSQITSVGDADRIHTYAVAGTYTVEIIGECSGWAFGNGGDKLKLRKIISWGDPCGFRGFRSLRDGFYGCTNLSSLPSSGMILAMGNGCDRFQQTFRGCTGLTNIPNDLFKLHTAVSTNGFDATFYGCTGLTSIPTDLFRYNTNVSTLGFNATFSGCTGLTSIPIDLFRYNTNVSTNGFQQTFYGCSGLTSIPIDLFRYNTNVSTNGFYETFRGCSSLTGAIPSDLFRYNTLISSSGFLGTFYNCSGLTGSIPTDLFRYNTLVSSAGFYSSFYGCSGLTGVIPVDLFRYNTLVSTNGFYQTFSLCSGLTGAIPSDLFQYNTLVSSAGFYRTFYGCSGLTSIPIDLFRYNTNVSTNGFYETFRGCSSLTGAIPPDLFRYNTNVSTNGFYETFYGCSGLTSSIPADLFIYNTLVSSSGFYGTFSGCSGLTGAIPADLFRYNTLVSNQGFCQTFRNCSGITGSIPTDLFRYNTLVSDQGFGQAFYNCSGLTGSIPTDLFRYNTLVSSNGFYQTFYNCSGLTGSIPTDLFRYNTLVSSNGFYQTFYNCSGLTSVPADLFRYNTACTSFYGTFESCVKLQLNRNIFFADSQEGTRFLNQSVDFSNCFSRTSYTGVLGEAPRVWICNFGTGTPTKTSCFYGAGNSLTSLSNYPDELITLDVAPATDWAIGDVITGQTSGKTCVVQGKVTATTYVVNTRSGVFTLGEIVGVTGNPSKLADQGAARPTFGTSTWK